MAKKVAKLTLSQKLAKAKKDAEKARAKILKDGKKILKESIREIFKENKKLESFSWDQYTPHWNDGDECIFSCYFDSLAINDERENDDIESTYQLEQMQKLLRNKEKEEVKIIMELSSKKGKQDWEVDRLKDQLKTIKTRDLQEVTEKYKIKKQILDILEQIDYDVYEYMFGEGTVVVTRKGIDVEDCEHD